MITVHVPAMTARADARVVSAAISDVPGVRTLRVDLATRTVRVTGSADPAAVTDAVTATGYAVEERPHPAPGTTTEAQPGGSPGESPRAPQRPFIPTPHHPLPRSTPMLSDTARTFIGSTTFNVYGMTCAHCQRAVTEEISAVEGVESVDVDLATGTVTVTAARAVDRGHIAAAVDEAGYVVLP
jgi:copper ion binding protein